MPAKRKTVNISGLVDRANTILLTSTLSEEYRKGVCNMIEGALSDANAYDGFRYLTRSDGVPVGHAVGKNTNPDGSCDDMTIPEIFHNTDETRKHYFYKK